MLTSEPIIAQAEHSVSLFDLLSTTEQALYFVVDPAQLPTFWSFWSAFQPRAEQEWRALFAGTRFSVLAEHSPLLVRVHDGSAGETLYYWLMEQLGDAPWGMLLTSTLSLAELHQHFVPWLTCCVDHGSEIFLRFYDPLVFRRLCYVLNESDLFALHRQQVNFYLPEAEQQNCYRQWLLPATSATTMASSVSQHTPCQLTQEQHQALLADQAYYALAIKIMNNPHHRVAVDSLQQIFEGLYQGIALAKERFPTEEVMAIEAFAAYRFYLGSDVYLAPAFQQALTTMPLLAAVQYLYRDVSLRQQLQRQFHRDDWLVTRPIQEKQ